MSEVQGFVRVRRRVLNHHQLLPVRLLSVVSFGVDGFELLYPERIGDG